MDIFEEKFKRVGHYEYDMQQRPIGRGRMSFIYRGVNTTDKTPVAIKVIALKDRERDFDIDDVKHDIAFLQQIPATHVVKFIDLKLTSHNIYIMTELIEGETLAQYLKQHRKMPEDKAVSMLSQIAQAFLDVDRMSKKHSDYKFYRKHGDLTPGKIMLLKNGIIKVADFGIPSLVEKLVDVMMITQYIPTRYFPYECPQRLRFESYGPKCDVWSAGVILYEALHGHTPWGEDNSMNEQARKIDHEPIVFDHLVSADVQNLIRHMLKASERDRLSWEQVLQHPALHKVHVKQTKQPLFFSLDHKMLLVHRKQSEEEHPTHQILKHHPLSQTHQHYSPTHHQRSPKQRSPKQQNQSLNEQHGHLNQENEHKIKQHLLQQLEQKEPEDSQKSHLEELHHEQDPTPVDESLDPIGILASVVLAGSEKDKPTPQQVMAIAKRIGILLTSRELQDIYKYIVFLLGCYDCVNNLSVQLAELPKTTIPTKHKAIKLLVDRKINSHLTPEENPYNAWLFKSSVKAHTPHGKLVGMTLVLNDTIALKGAPVRGGSKALSDKTLDADAFVTLKALAQGVEIVGKTNCENFQLSDNSFLSDFGPVLNPFDEECQAGGACSGCAVILAQKEAELAIATDFDGSGRLPAAYCGVYAMKPTRGLLPMEGIATIDEFLDQICLLSSSVVNNALLLEALTDTEEEKSFELENGRYTGGIEKEIKGMRIGLLEEGFSLSMGSVEVVEMIRKSLDKFESLGASLVNVSNPEHSQLGIQLWTILCAEGFAKKLQQNSAHIDKHKLNILAKLYALVGEFGDEQYKGEMFKKAMTLAKTLSESYDAILKDCDVIVMPTSTLIAPKLPPKHNVESGFLSSFGSRNTVQFNVTGHPALQVPCGRVCGMPVGLTIVGKHFDEKTIYRVAYALLDPIKVLEFD